TCSRPAFGSTLTVPEHVDVLVLPKLENVELRDWKAYDASVEAGYQAAREALSQSTLVAAEYPPSSAAPTAPGAPLLDTKIRTG
ncbi:MAG: hypothetical protein AAGJ84_16180, partial [Pseudomonadota bacterium]